MFKLKTAKKVRRGAVRKSEQKPDRRPVFITLAVMIVVSVLSYSVWQFRQFDSGSLFPIKRVAIEGNFKHLSTKVMQQRVMSALQGGYFSVNLDAIRTALLQMPWVDNVSVRRNWPPSLNIYVTEKHAVAYWGKNSLISDKGVLFTPVEISHQMPLPQLNGPDQLYTKVWMFAAEASAQLVKLGMRTEKVSMDDRRAWRIYVEKDDVAASQKNNLIEINLGRADTEQRLDRFLRVFAMKNAPSLNNIAVVDMRYPNGFAMRSRSADKKEA